MAGRLLTALVGVPLLFATIWFGVPWLTLVVAIAVLLGMHEYLQMAPFPNTWVLSLLAGLWGTSIVVAAQVAGPWFDYLPHLVLAGGILLATPWLVWNLTAGLGINKWLYWVVGSVYIAFLLSHALLIREMDGAADLGRNWLLFALIVVFVTDTGAFVTGSLAGRHLMAPTISPAKTWEGAFGGFLWAIVVAMLLGYFLELSVPIWQVAIVGAAVGIISQIGDLLESRLKRASGVKDAGSLLPGHGGVLDRADSIVLALPAVYYLVTFVLEPSG